MLYRATISIPSQVPVGAYTAETFLVDRGRVLAAATREIQIDKSGFERFVALAARRHAFLYGLVAVLLSLLFSPVVRRLRKARIPEAVSAAAILLALLSTASVALYGLSGPAASWMAQAPQALSQVETKLRTLARPMRKVTETADHVDKMTDLSTGARSRWS